MSAARVLMVVALALTVGASARVAFVKDRPGHDRRYAMDISKAATELGWQPTESSHTGLRKTIDWYLANPEWVEQVREESGYSDWIEKNYTKR